MSDLHFGTDVFSEFDRLHQQMMNLLGGFPFSIRASGLGAFPQVNIGATDESIEVVAFAPGVEASKLDVSVDKGLLTISGEREPVTPEGDEVRTYAQERFSGKFRRMVELPESADPDKVQARYENGCLMIRVGKREASKPRAITIQ
ncbi:Hsp20/alpha crystallin family protein [Burkholderia sp. Bp8963]|uniref:Hsp20/alpha crystallin family protein n=1 Tax=Burkholderia sp. Bp8963 TaxID=2184547 RepID=UPI000F59FCA3|nr:Hsp20/alpha crystallin family protein [Burkholderia sp. Bp8963]RQS63556.1 Hsp20/alpha crystallin family protein [Burkholderia sp. Bp8963]